MAVDTHDDERPPELMSEADRRLMEAAAAPPGEATLDMSAMAMVSLTGPPLAAPDAEPVDEITALREDNQRRVVDLQKERKRLALEALTDTKAAKSLEDVESELRAGEARDERLMLAQGERRDRHSAAVRAATDQARAEALDAARELAVKRENAAGLVDASARAYATALAAYHKIVAEQSDRMTAAGRPPGQNAGRTVAFAVEHGLAHALGEAGVRDAVDIRTPNVNHIVPLAKADPAPVLGATDAG